MRKSLTLLLLASLILASCGWRDSRVNPRNWFGESRSESRVPEEAGEALNPLLPRARRGIFQRPEAEDFSELIAEISELQIERTNAGAIILAKGVASRQGAYDTELRRVEDSPEGVLIYEFRVVYPRDPTPVGSAFVRTVTEAASVTHQDLVGIRTIRVIGTGNQRETSRRG